MAGDLLSCLAPSAQRFTACVDCGGAVQYRSRKPLRCPQCAVVAKNQVCANYNRRVRQSKVSLGEIFPCATCGDQVRRVSATQRYCTSCGLSASRKYRDEWSGVATHLGDELICDRCHKNCERTAGRQKYCAGCRDDAILESARTKARERSRRRGCVALGQLRNCIRCSASFETRAWNQTACATCQPVVQLQRAVQRSLQRRQADSRAKLNHRMGNMVRFCLKGRKARRSWMTLVGYSVDELTTHLERQFSRRMTWQNYGKWHIDHIRPISSFAFDGPEDEGFKAAWALTNLRPLWASENLTKRAKRLFLI